MWVRSLVEDHEAADVSRRQRAMLTYAVKLTVTPGAMTVDDLVVMRDLGLTDCDILDVNQVVGYFAYVNRLADGLGVVTDAYAETAYSTLLERTNPASS